VIRGVVGTAALCGGGASAAWASLGWIRHARDPAQRPPRWTTYAVAGGAVAAAAVLQWALLANDFSVRYVADNGGRDVPVYYTVTSMWAALEGSLLLWLVILGLFTVLVLRRPPRQAPGWHAPALAVLCGVAACFFALALLAGNPFLPVDPVPLDGPGPNPLLRSHPAVGFHPPLLYAGYVGLAVPFAYAVALLCRGGDPVAWSRAVRPWVLAAWAALTAGIALGAWWSYAVLGWGGYWAWDPVENASLMPWLTATALAHSVLAQRHRRPVAAWSVTLTAVTFFLVILGTFLTRSGAVGSVHSFTRSRVGPILLGFLATAILGWLVLLAVRGDRLRPSPVGVAPQRLLSRGAAITGNNLLLLAVTATTLTGTLYPLARQAADGQEVSVGAPYYNRVLAPVAFAVLILMAVGPVIRWHGDSLRELARRAAIPAAVAAVVAGGAGLLGVDGVAAVLAWGVAAFVLAVLFGQVVRAGPARRRPMVGALVAHLGVALAAVGVIGSARGTSIERQLPLNGTAAVAGVSARLIQIEPRGESARATVELATAGRRLGTAYPALLAFPKQGMIVARPAIHTGVRDDVYLTLLAVDPQGNAAVVRLAVNPLMAPLWLAAALLVAGITVSGWPRRRRRPHEPA